MQPDPAPRVTLKQSLGHQSLGRRLLHHLPALLGLGLLGGACFVVWRQFRHLKFEQVAAAVRDLPTHAVLMAAVWTFFAYFVLTFYDQLGTIYAGHKVSYRRASFASFCAYTLSHNLGLAAVSGAAVRYRLYSHWGLSPVQIAKVVAFCSLTFGLGAMVLAGIVLWVEPDTVPFFGPLAPRWVMHLAGLLFWGVVGGYVTLAKLFPVFTFRGTHVELPQLRMAMVQVALATLDVAMTATIFYALLPPAPGLTWLRFLGVYLASYSAGLVASLPGGLLVFDSAMLLGLAKWVHEPQVLSAIVIYRLFYYIIPLFMAGGLFAGNELMLRGGSIWRRLRGAPGRPGGPRAPSWSEPDFAVATATGAVALCGFLLLALSVVSPRPDFSWIDPELADVAAEAGQYIPSLIGAGLLVLATGLGRRVNLAWTATITLLVLGAVFSIAEGDRFWIALMLLMTALLVVPFRSAFYRHARLFSGPLSVESFVPLLALVACVVVLASFQKHVRFYAENAWWELVLSRDVPNGLRAAMLLCVVIALAAIWRLVHPGRVTYLPWSDETGQRYARMGGVPPADAEGLMLGEAERAGVPFRRCGRLILALGDPAGDADDRVSAIWRLRDLAQQEGRDPAIWQAGEGLLKIYSDLGMTALPLGQDGMPVPEDERTQRAKGTRYLVCVAERDLSLLLPLLPALQAELV